VSGDQHVGGGMHPAGRGDLGEAAGRLRAPPHGASQQG
jgi:hypothetical protein